MDFFIKLMFLVILGVVGLVQNANLSTHARATEYLKEDLEIAVHDSALFLDQNKLSEGKFVFDQEKAKKIFKESFTRNTGLSSGEYNIVEFKFFDQSNSTFPVQYKPSTVNFEDEFTSPTVVAVIETTVDKYFTGASKDVVRRVASYSYKVNLKNQYNSGVSSEVIQNIKANENGMFWVVPFTKNLTSQFGSRIDPITGVQGEFHKGIDISIANIENKPAVSAQDGKVIVAGQVNGYGNLVIIQHKNGLETRYGHLNAIAVSVGQEVKGGQIIGYIGSTGNSTGAHLHFETRYKGQLVDPLQFY